MKKQWTLAALVCAMTILILDSRAASGDAAEALKLCACTLIPSLFPLLVLSAMLVPGLKLLRLPFLARLLGMPAGSEGLLLLGLAGGFPVGAACIAQAVRGGTLSDADGRRLLGLCSFCGPSFQFGVLPRLLPPKLVGAVFLIQLEAGLLLAAFWPGRSRRTYLACAEAVSLPEAVRQSTSSMLSICAWVTLASVAAGFLRRWLFPVLPASAAPILTGLLELTNGIFALEHTDLSQTFVLSTVFVCFGGISVLLQIGGLASGAGLSMGRCIAQKALHGILGAVTAAAYLHLGLVVLLVPPGLLLVKIVLEIPGAMVYNGTRKEGI